MNSLVPFRAPDSNLPPARRALSRLGGEERALESEITKLKSMRAKVAAETTKVEIAVRERDAQIREDAASLFDRMMSGLDTALATLGGRAQSIDEQIAASKIQAEIGARTIAKADSEIERLEAALLDVRGRRDEAAKAVIREAAEGLYHDHVAIIEDFRASLTRLAALERLLAPERSDWAPASRLAITIPNFLWGDVASDTVILCPEREIKKAAEVFARFASALDRIRSRRLASFRRSTRTKIPTCRITRAPASSRRRSPGQPST
jgi:hypothetical protein